MTTRQIYKEIYAVKSQDRLDSQDSGGADRLQSLGLKICHAVRSRVQLPTGTLWLRHLKWSFLKNNVCLGRKKTAVSWAQSAGAWEGQIPEYIPRWIRNQQPIQVREAASGASRNSADACGISGFIFVCAPDSRKCSWHQRGRKHELQHSFGSLTAWLQVYYLLGY